MKQHILRIVLLFLATAVIVSCGKKVDTKSPWGSADGSKLAGSALTLNEIVSNGEMIIAVLSGPDTYFEYHGTNLGLQYLLCEDYAQSIGVALRVEVCRDTVEMLDKLAAAEVDLVAVPVMPTDDVTVCDVTTEEGFSWVVAKDNTSLAESLNEWFDVSLIEKTKKEEERLITTPHVTRHVYSPLLDREHGVISEYDNLFKTYASVAGWDWRLLAAQCYQESTFDPRAHSWAGACGLMQLMPSTARSFGVAESDIYDPETNVSTAAKLISQLSSSFSDVSESYERMCFVLASYNGGSGHVRDAMALASKDGKNSKSWAVVRDYVLMLMQPEYYRDPLVKYGYIRGTETVDYVDHVVRRWNDYCGVPSDAEFAPVSPEDNAPRRASNRSDKYRL